MKNKKLISKLGYSDGSPFKDEPYLDIHTSNGKIDMSNTGVPLLANGRILPPYSGIHHFDTDIVREIPLPKAQSLGEIKDRLSNYLSGNEGLLPGNQTSIKQSVKDRLYNSVTPIAYDPKHAMKEFVAGKQLPFMWDGKETSFNEFQNQPMFRGDAEYGEYSKNASMDAWGNYLGMPQKYDTFKQSSYQPGSFSFNNDDDIWDDVLHLDIINKLKEGQDEQVYDSAAGGFSLNNYILKKELDKDIDMPYVSYRDKNDYNVKLGPFNIEGESIVGNPFNVYGRMYYDPETNERLSEEDIYKLKLNKSRNRNLQKQEGGEYEELELTDEEIEEYKKGGYVVEELPKAQKVGEINKEWIKNWIEARNATGRFEDQLGDGQMEKGFKNLDNVKKVSRDEMVEKGYDEASYWQMLPPSGMYGPSDNIYFAEPTPLQRFFMGKLEEHTDVHEQSHVFDIGTSGLAGTNMEEIPETNIHKAIKNIPTKGGYKTEEYLPAAEIYAELMKLRKKNNIDPNKVFTEDDLLELRKKLKEESAYGLFKLDDIYEDKEILRLMNEVATINTPQENNLSIAKKGGALPKAQNAGEVPTRSDSLFLLNNNKIINDLKNDDYLISNNVTYEPSGIDDGNYVPMFKSDQSDIGLNNWPKKFKTIVGSRINSIKGEISKEEKGSARKSESKKGSFNDYWKTKGDFVGTSDWLAGGGDDLGYPIQYLHPQIAPNFQSDFYHNTSTPGGLPAPSSKKPTIYSYGYDDLAITPWDMLSDDQKKLRVNKYGISGTPYKNIDEAFLSVNKPTSYADAYKNVDKDKYPTLESFIEAAENYKKYGSNTKPESKSKETKVLKSKAEEKKLKKSITKKEVIKKPEIPEGYALSKGYQRDGVSYGDKWHDTESTRPAISVGPTMDDYYSKYPKSSDIAIDDDDFQSGGTVSQLWKQATGTPWSEAKKKGLTDGSYANNIALRKRIISGEFNSVPSQTSSRYIKEDFDYEKYGENIKRLLEKGNTLDDLVRKRIGTRVGLTNMFPELFGMPQMPEIPEQTFEPLTQNLPDAVVEEDVDSPPTTPATPNKQVKESKEEPSKTPFWITKSPIELDPNYTFPEKNKKQDGLKSFLSQFENDQELLTDEQRQSLYLSVINQFELGGQYMDLDLTEEEIKEYQKGGFVVEDLPEYQAPPGQVISSTYNDYPFQMPEIVDTNLNDTITPYSDKKRFNSYTITGDPNKPHRRSAGNIIYDMFHKPGSSEIKHDFNFKYGGENKYQKPPGQVSSYGLHAPIDATNDWGDGRVADGIDPEIQKRVDDYYYSIPRVVNDMNKQTAGMAEFTGIPSALRIIDHPKQIAKDVVNTAADVAEILNPFSLDGVGHMLPDSSQKKLKKVGFDFDSKNVFNNPYGSGIEGATDAMIMAPLIKPAGNVLKGAKNIIPKLTNPLNKTLKQTQIIDDIVVPQIQQKPAKSFFHGNNAYNQNIDEQLALANKKIEAKNLKLKRLKNHKNKGIRDQYKDVRYNELITSIEPLENVDEYVKPLIENFNNPAAREKLVNLGIKDPDDFMSYLMNEVQYTNIPGRGGFAGKLAKGNVDNVDDLFNLGIDQHNKVFSHVPNPTSTVGDHEIGHLMQLYMEKRGLIKNKSTDFDRMASKFFRENKRTDDFIGANELEKYQYTQKDYGPNRENLLLPEDRYNVELLDLQDDLAGAKRNLELDKQWGGSDEKFVKSLNDHVEEATRNLDNFKKRFPNQDAHIDKTSLQLEPLAMLRELRNELYQSGAIKNFQDPIDDKILMNFWRSDNGKQNRILSFLQPSKKGRSGIVDLINKTPIVAGAIGTGTILSQEEDGGEIGYKSEEEIRDLINQGYDIEYLD